MAYKGKYELWELLASLKNGCRWLDLSFELSPQTPHWQGFKPLDVKPLYTFENTDGVFRANQYTVSGQYGTHVDFPAHFDPGGRLAHEYGVKDMAYPLLVIDKSAEVKANPDYELSRQDVLEFEKVNGPVPEGSFVVFRSDWSKRVAEEYENKDAEGNSHFPGWDIEALKYLIEERNVGAIGHETPDTDSAVSGNDLGMVCEDYVLKQGKLNVELLRGLDQVPAMGAVAFITFPNVRDGLGFPSRVFAIAPV
ncbi:MAG: cyclase family protein [Spirochaetaceae bacterium]|nr:cyclase family protein [Spirochaetaceae bacterium]